MPKLSLSYELNNSSGNNKRIAVEANKMLRIVDKTIERHG